MTIHEDSIDLEQYELVEDEVEFIETYYAKCSCGSEEFSTPTLKRAPAFVRGSRVTTDLYRAECASCGRTYCVYQDGEEVMMREAARIVKTDSLCGSR